MSNRSCILADLEDYILSAGTDEEIAAEHGAHPMLVAELRQELNDRDRMADIRHRALELRYLLGSEESIGDLVCRLLEDAIVERLAECMADAAE